MKSLWSQRWSAGERGCCLLFRNRTLPTRNTSSESLLFFSETFSALDSHWEDFWVYVFGCFCESYLEHEASSNDREPSSKKQPFYRLFLQVAGSTVGAVDPTVVLVRGIRMRQMSRERTKQVDGPGKASKARRDTELVDFIEVSIWLQQVSITMFHYVSLVFFSPKFCVHFELVSVFHDRFTPTSSFRTLTVVHMADATSFPLGEERVGCPGGGKPQVTRWGRRVS